MQLVDMLGPRRYIGVQLITLTPELRRHFGVPDDRGVMVSKVLEDTPAAAAGIEVGDVLVTADGSPIDNAGDVTKVLSGKEPGASVRIDLWREGAATALEVGFEEREAKMFNIEAPAMLSPADVPRAGRSPDRRTRPRRQDHHRSARCARRSSTTRCARSTSTSAARSGRSEPSSSRASTSTRCSSA